MRTIDSNGGKVQIVETGDTSPNKGKRRSDTASWLAVQKRMKQPQTNKATLLECLRMLFEHTPEDLIVLLKNGKLPVVLAVIAKGWLDKKDGFDNMRKTIEMVFGKPQEYTDITTAGETLNNPFMEMPYKELKKFYENIQAKKKKEEEKKKGKDAGKK